MNTIEYYLKQLDYYRVMLISKLRDLGIECSDNEKYNTLIPKVYSLKNSGELVVEDYSLAGYDGSNESCLYTQTHTVVTGQCTSFREKFSNMANVNDILLYKWDTSKVKYIETMLTGTPGPIRLDAHGCDLSLVDSYYTSRVDAVYSTPCLEELYVDNAILSLKAFCCLTYQQSKLTTLRGLDTCEIIMPDTTPLLLRAFLYEIGVDEDLTPILNLLENKTFYKSEDTCFKSMTNLSYPLIFPQCFFDVTKSGTYLLNMTNIPYCKHVDLSNVELTNIPESDTVARSFHFSSIGNKLDIDDLSDAVFKLPKNLELIPLTTLNISANYLIKSLDDFYKLHYKKYSSISISSTFITEVDFNNFINVDDKTAIASPSNHAQMPLLERYINNVGGSISFGSSGWSYINLCGCPKLSYLDLSNNTISNLKYLFVNTKNSPQESIPENLKYIIFDNCTFNDPNGTASQLLQCTNLELASFKNVVVSKTAYNNFYYIKPITLDLEGTNLKVITFAAGLICNNERLVNLIMGDNFGQGFTSKSTLSLTAALHLTKESVLDLFNKIYDLNNIVVYQVRPSNIKLHADVLSQLTPEEIAIATNKGWAVS